MNNHTKNLQATTEGARCEGFQQGYAQAESDLESFLKQSAEAFGSRRTLVNFLNIAFQDFRNRRL